MLGTIGISCCSQERDTSIVSKSKYRNLSEIGEKSSKNVFLIFTDHEILCLLIHIPNTEPRLPLSFIKNV